MLQLGRPATGLVLLGALLLSACGSTGADEGGVGGDPARARVTPGALVAIAMSHLDLTEGPDYFESLDLAGEDPQTAQAGMRFRSGNGNDGDLVQVAVSAPRPVPPCSDPRRCVRTRTGAGTLVLSWDLEAPEEDPGVVSVLLYTDKEVRKIYLSGPKITKDPRRMDLRYVHSVEKMQSVVEDPDFALSTTQGAVDAGHALKAWKGRDTPAPEAGPRVPWTGRGLAALAGRRLWYLDRYGDAVAPEPGGPVGRAAGIRFNGDFDEGGGSVAMYLLADPPAGATTCPQGFQCARDGDLTNGWDGRNALIFRERDGFVLRTYLHGLVRDVTGPKDFTSGELARLVEFTSDPDLGARMSSDWIRLGAGLVDYDEAGAPKS